MTSPWTPRRATISDLKARVRSMGREGVAVALRQVPAPALEKLRRSAGEIASRSVDSRFSTRDVVLTCHPSG